MQARALNNLSEAGCSCIGLHREVWAYERLFSHVVAPKSWPEELSAVTLQCLEADPKRRPTAAQVVSRLERWAAAQSEHA